MKYFEILGIPEKLTIDPKILERTFHAESRKWHPDRFARAAPDEQQRALDISASLNDAYRTLRDPIARSEYVLSQKGVAPGDASKAPPELLEEVFELNMALEEAKAGDSGAYPQLRGARTRFQTMLAETDREIENDWLTWDASAESAVLQRLRALLNRRKYISNLVRDTEKALEDHVSD